MSRWESRQTNAHAQAGWELIHLFLDACPNPCLVRATREIIDTLAYLLTATRDETTTRWPALEDGYPRLQAAVTDNDPVAAELAIETVSRLQ
ncbi:hypothetical protein [Microbacterium oxydans]|uniref:hypothetical protein n=1 Tax=Microbacterium oxydans TaxID=82380 RepID=UPI00226B751B|nr:hypothetical protein [Microbacterium oxydans]WAA65601.1 hypothetical protein MME74_15405 [Microbacterium oxydans]